MRWIFFSLIVGNVALAAYWYVSLQERAVSAEQVSVSKRGVSAGLTLLRELPLKTQASSPASSVESVRIKKSESSPGISNNSESAEGSPALLLCVLVGSFADESSASVFLEKLSAYGVAAQMKNLLVSSAVGFWLHLPPADSRKTLLRRLSELQRQGIDSYIIPDGDLAYGISLGMFSEESRAEKLKNAIEQLGYFPEIAEVPREKRELWVFMTKQESLKIGDESWSDMLSEQEFLQKQQNLCSDVASV